MRSVGNAIKEAKRNLVASRLFGDYLAVAVLDVDQASKNIEEEKWPNVWEPAIDRLSKVKKGPDDSILPLTVNIFAIANVVPNMANMRSSHSRKASDSH